MAQDDMGAELDALDLTDTNHSPNNQAAPFGGDAPKKIKRQVVQKGFYSDEEDSSTKEEVYVESALGPTLSTLSAMRQRNILGLPGVQQPIAATMDMGAEEDMDLDDCYCNVPCLY
jgi:hypothetical protein